MGSLFPAEPAEVWTRSLEHCHHPVSFPAARLSLGKGTSLERPSAAALGGAAELGLVAERGVAEKRSWKVTLMGERWNGCVLKGADVPVVSGVKPEGPSVWGRITFAKRDVVW